VFQYVALLTIALTSLDVITAVFCVAVLLVAIARASLARGYCGRIKRRSGLTPDPLNNLPSGAVHTEADKFHSGRRAGIAAGQETRRRSQFWQRDVENPRQFPLIVGTEQLGTAQETGSKGRKREDSVHGTAAQGGAIPL